MNGRFDYVLYDNTAKEKQESLKQLFETLENSVAANLPEGRAQSLCLTHLEEAYMWTGKAIRDEQLARNSQVHHTPERSNV